jgi:hypothetical protein
MNFEEKVRTIRENKAREVRERKESDRRIYLARTALKETWEKVTQAIVQSGIQLDAQAATPEGIARGNAVNKRRPHDTTELFLGEPRIRRVPQHVHRTWNRAVLDAVGSMVQPAWDMESYVEQYGGYGNYRYRHSRTGHESGRLYLAQDSTIYRLSSIDPARYGQGMDFGESGYSYYPISTCMELRDDVAGALEMALATLVAGRDLKL